MNEKQAIKILKEEKSWESDDRKIDAFLMGTEALEEIQKYRAMEKRLDAIYGDCPGLLETVVKHLERHDGIGTDKPAFKARLLTDDNVDKWDSYKEIGTPEECRAAVEKQKAKKPIRNDKCTCPSCGTHNEVIKKRRNTVYSDIVYCWHCGQALKIFRSDGE